MRISDWSSDVCSSDLTAARQLPPIDFVTRRIGHPSRSLPSGSGGIAVIDPEVGITVPTAVPNYTIRAVATIAHGMADVPRMTHCRHAVVGSRDWIRKVTLCRCNLPPPLIVQGALVPAGSRIGADEIFPCVLFCGARPPAAGSPSIIEIGRAHV